MDEREPISRTYRFAMTACSPLVRWWGRLEVEGAELLPTSGPTLVVGNHDSQWDPVVIGIAGRKRRQIRALAKASLWKVPGLAPILRGMGQIPIERGKADSGALDEAIRQLRAGACIGVFPEGTISRGVVLRARSGMGRLALAVPENEIVCVTVTGAVDIVRFPKRPRIKARFFLPGEGGLRDGEDATGLPVRLLAEIRSLAPIAQSGRKRKAAANDAKLAEVAGATEA
ncbi:MAG: lysophospholipid acyltransferase family protein [Solirubrobacterales bacterium]